MSHVTRRRLLVLLLPLLACIGPWTAGCRDADPVAPGDALLSITANPPAIALGGTSRITVIASRSDGVPVVDGTEIKMTTTLGSIPSEIYTKDGIAVSTLEGGTLAGDAEVVATAGAATPASTTVKIGTTTATLTISANPGSFAYGGGTSTITCIAYDEESQPLSGIPVQFSTDKGSLGSGGALLYTDGSGVVRDTLRTTLTATVTATSGGLTPASVTVTVEDEDPTDPPTSPGSVTVTASPNPVAPFQPSTIIATVFDASGLPLPGAGVVFSTTAGTLASGGGLSYTNSNGQVADTLVTDRTATVTATAGTRTGSVTVQVSGGASSITLSANPSQFSACTDLITLVATVRDGSGIGVPGQTVSFSLGSGSIGSLSAILGTTDANGQAFTFLTVSQAECTTCATATCTSVVTATSGGLSASFTVNESF